MPLELEKIKREMLQNEKKLGWNKLYFSLAAYRLICHKGGEGGIPGPP